MHRTSDCKYIFKRVKERMKKLKETLEEKANIASKGCSILISFIGSCKKMKRTVLSKNEIF